MLSPCLFNLYAEYIMRNAGLEEAQAGIKIARRNIIARGSLTSPSYLVRNRTLGPPLENNPEIPPSSRDEGLRLLHGLATNLATSLQTPQEALEKMALLAHSKLSPYHT